MKERHVLTITSKYKSLYNLSNNEINNFIEEYSKEVNTNILKLLDEGFDIVDKIIIPITSTGDSNKIITPTIVIVFEKDKSINI